jgi:G3E family GTPase
MSQADITPFDGRIPVSLLTGFLGSGKTTVLNHLVRHPDLKQTLVIINEFGAIGLDHELIVHSQEDVVVEMSSGCLCCTVRGDLVRTLRDAVWRFSREGKPWFSRVIIETTGLADPAPVLHTLMTDAAIARQYRLDGVITTVDAATGRGTLARQPESRRQAAVADRLLLTKTDLASTAEVAALMERLRALNPAAPILQAAHGVVEPQRLLDAGLYDPRSKSLDVQRWLNAEAYRPDGGAHGTGHEHHHHDEGGEGHDDGQGGHDHRQGHDINRHDESIRASCLVLDRPIAGVEFDAWLQALLHLKGRDILRVKGIVNLRGVAGPVVIHGVQHIFHPPVVLKQWPSADRRSRIVFIARDLDEAALRETLEVFMEPASAYG